MNGKLDDGQTAEEYEIKDIRVTYNDINFLMLGTETKYVKTYIAGEKVYLEYERYFLKKIDLMGNIIDEYYSDFLESTSFKLKALSDHPSVLIIRKEYKPYRCSFQFADMDFNITDKICFVENGNSIDYWDCCYLDGKIYFFWYEYYETSEKFDRQKLWMTPYSIVSSIVLNPILISDDISSESLKNHDEFYFADIVSTGKNLLVCYSRNLNGVTTFGERIVNADGASISNTLLASDIQYIAIDKNGNLWEYYLDSTLIVNNDNQKIQGWIGHTKVPNYYDKGIEWFIDDTGYNKRFSPEQMMHGFETESNDRISSIWLSPYNQPNNQYYLNDLTISLQGNQIGQFSGELNKCKTIDVKGQVINGYNSLSFSQNSYLGGDIIVSFISQNNSIVKDFVIGWNWFSINVIGDTMDIASVLGSIAPKEGNYIKNQTKSSTYYDSYGWFGELTEISPKEMYKIKLIESDTLKLNGLAADPLTNVIPINVGWNWIGYIPQTALSITESLASIHPVGDDYIKNQNQSATFYENYGWFGELDSLYPWDGFMLKTSHTESLIYDQDTSGVPEYEALYSLSAPTIDGQVSTTEWANANYYTVTCTRNDGSDTKSATLYFQHDNIWLYVGVKTTINAGWNVYHQFRFDGNNDHAISGSSSEPHTDVQIEHASPGAWSGYTGYHYINGSSTPEVTAPTGTTWESYSSTSVNYEYKVKLSDLSTSAGQTIGFFMLTGTDGTPEHGYEFPLIAIRETPAQWAHISLKN